MLNFNQKKRNNETIAISFIKISDDSAGCVHSFTTE